MVQLLAQAGRDTGGRNSSSPRRKPDATKDLLKDALSLPRKERTPWLLKTIREMTGAWTTCLIRVDQEDEATILHLEGTEAPLILERATYHARASSLTGRMESDRLTIGRKQLLVTVYPLGNPSRHAGKNFLAVTLPIPAPEPERLINGFVEISAALFQETGERSRSWEDSFFHRRLLPGLAILGLMGSIPFIPLPVRIEVNGILEPIHQRTIPVTWEAPLEKILVHPGEQVLEGQPVAELNGDDLQRRIAESIADQNRAEKQEETATSLGKFREADLASLDQQRAIARQKSLEYQQDHLILSSPISGKVMKLPASGREGAWLRQGDPVVVVASIDRLKLMLSVPPERAHHLKAGQTVSIWIPGADREQAAVVSWVGPGLFAGESGRYLPVILEVTNLEGQLRPGQTAHARLGREWTPLYRTIWPDFAR